jgi:hypothetical protein
VSHRGESSAPAALGAGEFRWDFGGPERPEPVTTIAWRLAHLIVGFAEMNGSHFGGQPVSAATFEYAGTPQAALGQLDATHDAWIQGVRTLGNSGLAAPQGSKSPPEFADAPIARLVLYTSVEVFHHGAEICLLRDLYLRRSA